MTQYISKSALVAEIKNRRDSFYSISESCEKGASAKTGFYAQAQALEGILSFLDTLEVKEMDFEKDVRQILSLYYEGINHYDDIIKKERKENGGSNLAIKILDGVVDARELGIQYVIDKLKAQEGE